jgi:hypothetical protein
LAFGGDVALSVRPWSEFQARLDRQQPRRSNQIPVQFLNFIGETTKLASMK